MPGSAIEVGRLSEIQVLGEEVEQVGAALGDVVRQQFDAVDSHQRQQRVVPPLEVRFAVLEVHGCELASKNLHEEVAAAAGGLQEARIYALCLVLHEVKHGIDHPRGGEDFPVIGNALF